MLIPKKRILLMTDWFDPAYKAGGPIRSSVNFVKHLKDEFEIFVLTSDRDLNDAVAMNGIITNQWNEYVPGVKVLYASADKLGLKNIKEYIRTIDPSCIYLNSMFSKRFAVYPLWLKNFKRVSSRIVLAPRGMLKESALNFKKAKKKTFLSVLKWMKVPQTITFHATNETEKDEILLQFGKNISVVTIPNFPGSQDALKLPAGKKKGFLKLLFIGRLHPIKGLDVVLNALKKTEHEIELTIAGNSEDQVYYEQCRKLAGELPSNIRVSFIQEVPHHEIDKLLREHHLFCLPTKGENFGHAIFEALAVGRPVLISDQTPWRSLELKKAGWDIPVSDSSLFADKIETAALMDESEFNDWCRGAWQFCKNYIETSDLKQQYLKLFS